MIELYKYVGNNEIQQKVAAFPVGLRIESVSGLVVWLYQNRQKPNPSGLIAATITTKTREPKLNSSETRKFP
ncbi:hypothetical protein H6S82_12565 [Planktothrix sp. FACHB-1355]|uniref:Uncharacterized protein n=1 Tax=Aerosakkonema funiforme FACHB-1375 TaxID=2949571 RepID=A0A926VE17_9CYAN|nr:MULTISPECIES: hypothetical protein [Oscillatoriales]MBD2182012.1 hypothetical protein [Aerosakkonema funiforme FACHB-1375]MBD3559690.1 hypothetical protein [Planktothrix sp. FACHB-1355]